MTSQTPWPERLQKSSCHYYWGSAMTHCIILNVSSILKPTGVSNIQRKEPENIGQNIDTLNCFLEHVPSFISVGSYVPKSSINRWKCSPSLYYLINVIILLLSIGRCCNLRHWLPTGEEIIGAKPGTYNFFFKYLQAFSDRPEDVQHHIFMPFFQDFTL